MQITWLRRLALATALLCLSEAARGQSLRGVVTESQSGRPVAGAVVLLLDSAGALLTKGVTTESGTFSLRRPSGDFRGRVVRLGFRPRDLTRQEIADALTGAELAIKIVALPQMLEPVTARSGASCPKRKDRAAAFGFWEQAKAGLMASVYAREGNPGYITTFNYERYLEPNTDSVKLQKVTADSGLWTRTFTAQFSAKEFVDVGFLRAIGDGRDMYYGPDAEVLLENDFQTRYCFSLAPRDPARPTQVGLHFEPARFRINRVDIEGDFWIDTASRKLNDIVYTYLGLSGPPRRKPGGHVQFRELANGIPFVDSWDIQMATRVMRPVLRKARGGEPGNFGDTPTRNTFEFEITHAGGILAHARWPDSTRYDAPLGTARIHAVREDGTPVAGLKINLDSTFYGGVTDSSGNLTIIDMLPGPYATVIIDTTLDVIGLKLRSPLEFMAVADSVVEPELLVREAAAALANTCKDKSYGGWGMFVARVSTPDNKPIEGAHWTLGNKFGTTTSNGVILPCMPFRVPSGGTLAVWRDHGFPTPDRPFEIPFAITGMVTAIKVELPFPEDSKKPPPKKP